MSTNQDTVIAVAPTLGTGPAVAPLAPTLSNATATIADCERALASLFAQHRPNHAEMQEIAVLASLADRTVTRAHTSASAPLDAETVNEDLTNCAALYGYVLGYAAAQRTPRGA